MAPTYAKTPLSLIRRRIYFGTLVAIFIVAIPVLYLYATGYRFVGLTEVEPTGGLYVGAARADAEIYIDGELRRETGTFRRAFFVQNLTPGMHDVGVIKDGHHPWHKTLTVYPHIVTEARAFNVPISVALEEVPPMQPRTASSTPPTPNPLYEELVDAFAKTTSTTTVSTLSLIDTDLAFIPQSGTNAPTTTKVHDGMVLYEASDGITAEWIGDVEQIPFYFCSPEQCAHRTALNTKGERPRYFDFYPDTTDLAIVTLADGVYVTELDARSGQNIQPLYEGAADFRVLDGRVYLKVGTGATAEFFYAAL